MTDIHEVDTVAAMRAEFDEDFYLAVNKDVAEAGGDPFAHFLTFGWREGRDPNPHFSIRRYVAMNADVQLAGINGFAHYISSGRAERRPTDHGLGFQFETLWIAPTVETRIHNLATAIPDRAPTSTGRLEAAALLLKGREVHCTVGHDDPFTGVGGIQLCIRLEAKAFAEDGRDHVHLFPSAAAVVVDVERAAPTLAVMINGVMVGHFLHETVAQVLGPVVTRLRGTFAVHSLIGHRVDSTITVLKAMGMQAGYYWLHDFASLCAGYTLMRNDVAFCGAPPIDSTACEICAYGRRRRIQLAAHATFFEAFEITVVSPSQAALDLWKGRFPVQPAASVVHSHADLRLREAVRPPAEASSEKPLRIAFLGMPVLHKGWPSFADIAKRYSGDPRYEFHHLAKQQDPRVPALFTRVEPTARKTRPMIDAVERLKIDVAFIWSLWPETFCFAAYEAVAGGAAILTNPNSGHVVQFVGADSDRGAILHDEASLEALFAEGGIRQFSRSSRPSASYDLEVGAMTADLVRKAGQ